VRALPQKRCPLWVALFITGLVLGRAGFASMPESGYGTAGHGETSVAQAAPAVHVTLVAAEASREGRDEPSYDRELGPFREQLERLEYDTYRHVNTSRGVAQYQEETKLTATRDLAVLVTPIEKGRDGRIKVRTRLQLYEERAGKRTAINAATATSMVKPGDPLVHVIRVDERTYVLLLLIEE